MSIPRTSDQLSRTTPDLLGQSDRFLHMNMLCLAEPCTCVRGSFATDSKPSTETIDGKTVALLKLEYIQRRPNPSLVPLFKDIHGNDWAINTLSHI